MMMIIYLDNEYMIHTQVDKLLIFIVYANNETEIIWIMFTLAPH